jgi:sulfhydrogenase subunit beta (sulfur reductase)
MSIKKIAKGDFAGFVEAMIKKQKVIGVQAKGDRFDFAPLESAKDLRLDYDVSLQPPGRKVFLPPAEVLLTFEVGGGYKSQYQDEPFILLGVHPYDMVAINQMDELFRQDNYDTHYMARRANATIIACDVVTPSKDVFASSMGTAIVRQGFDILLTDIGDAYVAEAATDKGEELLALAKSSKADDASLKSRDAVWAKNKKGLNRYVLKCDPAYLPKLLAKAYTHPVWEERAKTCFSCGSCNQVCPTCYCFNVQDDVNWDLAGGTRCRAWDGCLLDGFTKVAGNHEFRKKRADRFRHRLYRKAQYVPAKIGGQIACVGCGRCVSACLPDIANPVSAYNRLIDDLGIG